tara:strand:- start:210 stop:368 length:159 start_codon:yes stop_codon:yes gene_type:complete
MYLPINTMNTAGAIIPISGTKIEGKKDDANSPDMASTLRYIGTVEICFQLRP